MKRKTSGHTRKTKKIIMKFGGTSVGSPVAIEQLIAIVSASQDPVAGVVVSAFSQVTNQLIEAAELASKGNKNYLAVFDEIVTRHKKTIVALLATPTLLEETEKNVKETLSELEKVLQGVFLLKELTPKILDMILSYGERLSGYIIAQGFKSKGIQAEFTDARKLVKTDGTFGAARVHLTHTYTLINEQFQKSKNTIHIITGYIGSTEKNETTTFGRGGSDYSASIFGAAINAAKIEIWTDVDGVLTADPNKVPTAFTIPQLTYQEAMEMSHFGAKVIYPQTMIPAYTNTIPLVIRNTFHPKFPGTIISKETHKKYIIKGISSMKDISLVLVQGSGLRGTPGIAARLFGALAIEGINIILITQASSEYSISLAIDSKDNEKAKKALEDEFKHEMQDRLVDALLIEEQLAIITVVGEQMVNAIGFDGKLFTSLGDEKINIKAIALGSSERNISFVVAATDEKNALNAVHKTFFGI